MTSFSFQMPLFNLFKHRKYVYYGMVLLWAIGLIMMCTPLGFPFREAVAPQRYTIWVSDTINHLSSFFWVLTSVSFFYSIVTGHSLDSTMSFVKLTVAFTSTVTTVSDPEQSKDSYRRCRTRQSSQKSVRRKSFVGFHSISGSITATGITRCGYQQIVLVLTNGPGSL